MENNVSRIIQEVANKTNLTFEQVSQIYLAPFKIQVEAINKGNLETIEIPRIFKMAPKESIKNNKTCKNLEKNQ